MLTSRGVSALADKCWVRSVLAGVAEEEEAEEEDEDDGEDYENSDDDGDDDDKGEGEDDEGNVGDAAASGMLLIPRFLTRFAAALAARTILPMRRGAFPSEPEPAGSPSSYHMKVLDPVIEGGRSTKKGKRRQASVPYWIVL